MTTQTNVISDFYTINDLLVVSIVSNTKRLYQIVDIKNDKLICKQIYNLNWKKKYTLPC